MCVSAPEVASMRPYGHASDWWSLGILMFALLVGQVYVRRFFTNTLMHCFFIIIVIVITLLHQWHTVVVVMVVWWWWYPWP